MNAVEKALKAHDHNMEQLTAALTAAGGDPVAVISGPVRDFMYSLASNSILLVAAYDGPVVKTAKAVKKPRKPREKKTPADASVGTHA